MGICVRTSTFIVEYVFVFSFFFHLAFHAYEKMCVAGKMCFCFSHSILLEGILWTLFISQSFIRNALSHLHWYISLNFGTQCKKMPILITIHLIYCTMLLYHCHICRRNDILIEIDNKDKMYSIQTVKVSDFQSKVLKPKMEVSSIFSGGGCSGGTKFCKNLSPSK